MSRAAAHYDAIVAEHARAQARVGERVESMRAALIRARPPAARQPRSSRET